MDSRVRLERQGLRDNREIQDSKVHRVLLDHQVSWEHQVPLVQQGQVALRDHGVTMEIRE
jgi:hypothetical protein